MAEHVERYLATDGDEGHLWRGVPTLLLTTKGRISGERRLVPLIYGEDDANYIVVGSKGGNASHPLSYTHLRAHET